jgi:hypothetical protein
MASPVSIGDLYLAGLAEEYGDTPSLDPKLVAQHAALLKVYADLAKGLDATQAKRALAQLSEQQKAFATVTKARASVAETRAKSSRVTAQNFQDAIEAAEKVDAALTLKANVTTPQYEAAARSFTRANGGEAGAVAAAQTLTSWFDDFTNQPLGPSHPNIDVIMNRTAEKLIGEPLTAESAPRLIAALGQGGSQQVRDRWTELVNAGALRRDETMALQAQNRAELDSIKDAAGKYARIQAGSPGAVSIEAQLDKFTSDLGPRLMKALGRDAADIAAEQELVVTQNAQLEKIKGEADRLGEIIYGGQKADPIARLVASPQFREWAEANGMQLGQASVDPTTGETTYTPGAQDAKAIALYKWQSEHPGRYSPIRRNKSTGAFVRVTVEDPAVRERVIAKYRAASGKFYMDTNGNLVPPQAAAEALEKGGYAPSVEMATVGGKAYLRKADGTVLDASTGQPATAPEGAKFVPALYYGADGSTRYLTNDDISTPDKVAALFSASEGAAGFGVLEPSDAEALQKHARMAPLAERTEDQMRSTWTNTVSGYLDAKHAADYSDPNFGGDTISLDGGAIRIPGGVPATIEILETKDRFSLGDVAKGWRRRMSEAHAEKLAAQGVPQADTAYLTGLAQEARAEFLERPPEAVAPPTTVKIPTTTAGGVETGVTVPIASPAAAAARAMGKTAPSTATAQILQAPDGKRYRYDTVAQTVTLLDPKAGEKSSWTMADVGEISADLARAEVVDFEGPTGDVSPEAATPEAAPTAAAPATPPAPAAPAAPPAPPVFPEAARRPEAPSPRVTLVPPAAQAIVDRTGERTSVGQRIGAAAAELFIPGRRGESDEAAAAGGGGGGAAAPGGTAPTTGPAAPQRGEAGAARRRPIRDLIERLRGRGPDEGMRAADKKFAEDEKKAAERTKERERLGAIGEMPVARTDVLTEAPDVTGAKTTSTREGARPSAARFGAEGTPESEAIMRGRDEALMGLIGRRTSEAGRGQGGYVPQFGDLARQYKDLQGLKQFNPSLYAQETRKLADEARERLRTPRSIEGKGALPAGGRVFGKGSVIEGETPVVRLPSSETELATSPFLARIFEGRQAREAVGAAPITTAERPEPREAAPQQVDRASLDALTKKTAGDIATMKTREERAAGSKKKLATFQQLQEEARKERMGGM